MSSSVSLVLLVLCAAAESQLRVFNLRATNLPPEFLGVSDGYVKVFCDGKFLGKTSVREEEANPRWDELFSYLEAKEKDVLRLEVYDADPLFDDLLGVCETRVEFENHTHNCFMDKGILHYTYSLG